METVVDGETGVYFHEQTVDALRQGIDKIASADWDPVVIRKNAERFSTANFIEGLDRCIAKCLE